MTTEPNDSIERIVADFRSGNFAWIDELFDRLEKLSAASVQVWQPIESAPKDGTHILAYGKGYGQYTHVTWWVPHIVAKCGERYGWHYPQNGWMEPTHWMPLPRSPQGESHGR